MATLATTHPTLLDVAKVTDPNGSIARIVELLNQQNEVLDDMVFIQGNLPTGHRTSVRTGLPEPTWRKLYGGVQPSKGSSAQVTDTIGNLEAYAEVDKDLADLNGNTESFRLTEDSAHIEGMSQEMAETVFYGDEGTAAEEFTGFAPRFNDLSAENADNIIDCGGTGADNTSIWLAVWGPNTVHGLYSKGFKAGLSMKDMGEVTVEDVDGNGGRAQMYRTHYKWQCGLSLRDWRYVVRIANIDVSELRALSGTQAITASTSILRALIRATERIPSFGMGRAAFYANRTVSENLRLAILDKVAPANLSFETVAGKRVVSWDGIPFRRVDKLHNAEAQVV